MTRWIWVVVLVAAVGCGGTDAEPQQAPPANGADPDHDTLGIWPNVVIPVGNPLTVNDQKTAADLLFEIMMQAEAAMAANKITDAELKALFIAVSKCGRNNKKPPVTIEQHAAALRSALNNAKLHTTQGWKDCTKELETGH